MSGLDHRHLYLCVPHRDDLTTFLPAVLRGGVDVVQLREKDLDDEVRIADATLMVPICRDFDVPFIMNDSPELAVAVGADGVHVGQEDVSVARCRELLGPEAIVGLSTHSTTEFDDALNQSATYFSAGPIVATPTKPGRAGTGVNYAVDQPGPQRPTGLRHRRRQRRERRRAGRGRSSSLRRRARPHRIERTPSERRGVSARHWTRRSQRCRSSQPNNVATIRGSARS